MNQLTLDGMPEPTVNRELQHLQEQIDQTLAWIGETREELKIAEARLSHLQRRRDQLEATA